MDALKPILLATASTILGGIMVAIFTSYFNAPEKASIHAEYRFVKIPNLPPRLYERLGKAVDDKILEIPPVPFEILRRATDLRITTATVKNDSDLKSRKIEVSIPPSVLWVAEGDRNNPTRAVAGSKYTIDSMAPGESASLVAIGTDLYRGPTFNALHDDRRAVAIPMTVDTDDPAGFFSLLVLSYPFVAGVLMMAGGAFMVVIALGTVLSLILGNAIAMQARLSSAKTLTTYRQILDYARQHYPEKAKEAGL
jgi:hypothetical protein